MFNIGSLVQGVMGALGGGAAGGGLGGIFEGITKALEGLKGLFGGGAAAAPAAAGGAAAADNNAKAAEGAGGDVLSKIMDFFKGLSGGQAAS